ncbi:MULTISPECIES: hypothetical protein [unclassified Bacillus (in: firmicutes)]|uniref:hypothetical protein n=1 Tax=unclassified Bacillus (in: firmicutes) TaxID=185979 RepID=UPI001BE9603B|nr:MULTISPECIES: hypothetical protein [unclassified Bacillus (in: firmicutes)]MBT2614440.1 hypothetical protein [Bacillus sp. ISL-78]MBT2628505.1 hypothetical protein [Bacillus sp. ISL-101]
MSTKNTDKPYIMIPNAIVRNNGISNMSKMIYTSLAMSRNINQTRLFQQTSINGLLGLVGFKQRTENQNMAKQGLIELEELNIISIYSDLALSKEIKPIYLKGSTMFFVKFNNDFVYSEEFLSRFEDEEIDKELINSGFTYTTVYIDDAVELFTFESKHSRVNIISFYLMAVSRALIGDKGDKYSTEKIESITKYANINEKTVSTYISALFDSKLLFKLTLREITKTGEIRDHNVYSRWCERDNITWKIESNDWFMNKTLFKIGDKELSETERNYLKNKSRKLHGLSEIY